MGTMMLSLGSIRGRGRAAAAPGPPPRARRRWRIAAACLALWLAPLAGADPIREPVTVERAAGEAGDLVLPLGPEHSGPGTLEIGPVVRAEDGRPADGVWVGFAGAQDPLPERWPEEPPQQGATLPADAGKDGIRVRILVRPCAEAGAYRVPVLARWSRPGTTTEVVSLRIEVAPTYGCARRRALAGVAAALPLLFGVWWFQAIRSSHFLPLERLGEVLRPQVYGLGQEAEDSERDVPLVRGQLTSQLHPWRRLGAWFRAWWKGGLSPIPRGPYEETAIVRLGRLPQLDMRLEGTLRASETMREDPKRFAGCLVVRATREREVQVSAIPDDEGRVSGLTLEKTGSTPVPGRWIDLDRRFALRPPGGREDRGTRGAAGWQVRPV